MFSAVNQFCQNYYNQIPSGGLKAVGLSAAVSFAASVTVITLTTPLNQGPTNLSRGVLAAGIACLAAAIHALTNPIFNHLFDNPNNDFNGFEQFLRMTIDISLVHLLINHTTAFKINLMTASNLRGGNFIILPNHVFKTAVDMSIRMSNFFGAGSVADGIRVFCTNFLDIDFNRNSPPVYVVV